MTTSGSPEGMQATAVSFASGTSFLIWCSDGRTQSFRKPEGMGLSTSFPACLGNTGRDWEFMALARSTDSGLEEPPHQSARALALLPSARAASRTGSSVHSMADRPCFPGRHMISPTSMYSTVYVELLRMPLFSPEKQKAVEVTLAW